MRNVFQKEYKMYDTKSGGFYVFIMHNSDDEIILKR